MKLEKLKKYVLFDLDGTLTDPKLGICSCVQYALAHFDIFEPDLDKLEPFIGPPLIDSFMEFYGFDEAKAREAVDKYRERFSTVGLFENEVYPGIKHMLKRLKKNGFHLAVASSKPQVFVERILEHFGLAKYFEVVVGSNLDGTRTDKAEIITEVFGQLFKNEKVDKELIYMVGDRKFDAIGAKKQGVESVCVAYGYGDLDELMDCHADYIVLTVKELEEFLMRQTYEAAEGRICYPKGWRAIPIRTVFSLIGAFFAFICIKGIAEVVFTFLFAAFGKFLPAPVWNYLSYASVLNENSFDYNGNLGTFINGLSYLLAGLAIWFPARKLIRATERDSRLLHPYRTSVWQYILGVIFVYTLSMSIQITAGLINAAQISEHYQQTSASQYSCDLIMGLLIYGIVSPLAEEILFRGYIYTVFRRYIPISFSVIMSSLLFGLYHFNAVQGIYAIIMGAIMALAYEYYGSFWAPVAVHMFANITAYLMSILLGSNEAVNSVLFVVIMAAIAVASGVMLWIFRKKRL